MTGAVKLNTIELLGFIYLFIYLFIINPHLKMCSLILERKGEGRAHRDRQRQTSMWETSTRETDINWMPPTHARNWTHNLLLHRMMLQPTEPPGHGKLLYVLETTAYILNSNCISFYHCYVIVYYTVFQRVVEFLTWIPFTQTGMVILEL